VVSQYTSVTCDVGLNVNALRTELIFHSKPNFCNLFEFQQQNPLKNQYHAHPSSENCEINSIKSDLMCAF